MNKSDMEEAFPEMSLQKRPITVMNIVICVYEKEVLLWS